MADKMSEFTTLSLFDNVCHQTSVRYKIWLRRVTKCLFFHWTIFCVWFFFSHKDTAPEVYTRQLKQHKKQVFDFYLYEFYLDLWYKIYKKNKINWHGVISLNKILGTSIPSCPKIIKWTEIPLNFHQILRGTAFRLCKSYFSFGGFVAYKIKLKFVPETIQY